MRWLLLCFFTTLLLCTSVSADSRAIYDNSSVKDAGGNETLGDGVPPAPAEHGLTHFAGDESNASAAQEQMLYHLDVVRITGEKIQAGKSTVKGVELHSLPSHTDSITEALKGRPNVQFSNEETSSDTGGEIRPPRVSIAGGKPYENNFLIDGMSVSNTLNPNGLDTDGDSVTPGQLDVNGADQTIFYDSSLVDSVTVYSSNVPAKFGNFVGGVVDAKLMDPRMDRWHAVLWGKHTRSEWSDLRNVDEESQTAASQPRFRTNSLKASADGPITENVALLIAATQKRSVIPLEFEESDGTFSDKDQYRSNENFFTKLLLVPTEDLKLTLDATYAPYVEKRWKQAYSDSEWKVENEAWRLGSSATYTTGWGLLTSKAAYSQNGFSRDSSNNFREQISGSGIPESESVMRGGLGDAISTNHNLDLGLGAEFKELKTDFLLWRISTGLDISNVTTDMWNEDTRIEIRTVPSNGKWIQTDADYLEYSQSKTLNTVGYYIQTEAQWDRFILTPGLRIDHDDFSRNTDIAPRLKAELDTMGDGALRIVAGVNRYYGTQLRAYAFDRHRPSFTRQERWNGVVRFTEGVDKNYQAKGLDTPYADELMSGVLGEVLGFEYGLELVHRDHKDKLISKTRKDDLYEMTNDGESTYDGVTLTIARSIETERFGTHTFTFGATQSKTKTFNGAYDSNIDVGNISNGYEYNYDKVYYDGKIIDRSDMPAEDFNAPLVATFSWLGSFYDDSFRVNCVSRWRDSTTGLRADSRPADETPYGTTASRPTTESAEWLNAESEYHNAYTKGVISGGLATDIGFEYDALKDDLYTLSLLLDVTNVFSSNEHTGVAESTAGRDRVRGRTFYAGLRCEF